MFVLEDFQVQQWIPFGLAGVTFTAGIIGALVCRSCSHWRKLWMAG